MSQLCPCGSSKTYAACCEIAHNNHADVSTPEQLMRSRYSAHALQLVDFVVNTYHPSCHAEAQREAIAESIHSDWVKLEVIRSEDGSHSDEGFVTFKAFFNEEGSQYCMSERSRFLREDGKWYYIDGEFIDADALKPEPIAQAESNKIGRNDPCICGSGKKYKKCCG